MSTRSLILPLPIAVAIVVSMAAGGAARADAGHTVVLQPKGTAKTRYIARVARSLAKEAKRNRDVSLAGRHARGVAGRDPVECAGDARCVAQAGKALDADRAVGVLVAPQGKGFELSFLLSDVATGRQLARKTYAIKKRDLPRTPGKLLAEFLAQAPAAPAANKAKGATASRTAANPAGDEPKADDPAAPTVSSAEAGAAELPAASTSRSFKQILDNHSIRVGLESADPILFKDTPDDMLEATSVFQYGGRLAFLFGSELLDTHRVGFGASYNYVAKSPSRTLKFLDVYLLYETGHPFVMQLGLGTNIGLGTKDFADSYEGVYGGAALRYSFLRENRFTSVTVSPGVVAKSYIVPDDMRFSSFFIGAQLEVAYSTNNN